MAVADSLTLAGQEVPPGGQQQIHLDAGRLYTGTPVELVVEVLHGLQPGPRLLVCAAVHGDELNGIEICRQLLQQSLLPSLCGSLIVVPVVNIFGFLQRTRYLPDRRDLNRCFPGANDGSSGSRLAQLFCDQVLQHCSHVIDLHTGAIHRSNLPQIRACLDNDEALAMARYFAAPLILEARLLPGSLRAVADDLGIPLILYEGGEALRFNQDAIQAGVQGVLNVMRGLHMLPADDTALVLDPAIARSSSWIRANEDGTCQFHAQLGDYVSNGQTLATISSPFHGGHQDVLAPFTGIVIGCNYLPLINAGDALYHIARCDNPTDAAAKVSAFRNALGSKSDPIVLPESLG